MRFDSRAVHLSGSTHPARSPAGFLFGCTTVVLHVDNIHHALATEDAATIRNGFLALITEARVAGLPATNAMALLEELAAALKNDDSIMPSQACHVLGIAVGSSYGVGAANVEGNRR